MKSKDKDKLSEKILIIGTIAWILSWFILAFKLDLLTYIAFMFYGLGISGITIYFTLKFVRIIK